MARIKIEDLPKDQKISKEELKRIMGGGEWLDKSSPKIFGFGLHGADRLIPGKMGDISLRRFGGQDLGE